MRAPIYQLIRDTGKSSFENEMFSASDFLPALEARGFAPNGAVGGDHLREELRGQPCFTELHGPMWGGMQGDQPIVRYEDWKVSELLSS